jgi:hypothetical protein
MSGGHFDYWQHHITTIADSIESLIDNNDDESVDEWGDRRGRGYPPEIIEKFREGVQKLNEAYVYAQRIDWLVSGDDGEDTFLKRLEQDLEMVKRGFEE